MFALSTCALVKVLVERFESFLIADGCLCVVPPQSCPSFLQTIDLQIIWKFIRIPMTFCLIRKIKRRSFPRWPQPITCLHLALPSHQLTLTFFHYIHKSLLCPPSSPPAFRFRPHHPSTQTFTVPPLYTSKPSQSFLPGFISKTSNVCLPSLRFLILSVLVTAEENLNLSISSSSSSASCPHLPPVTTCLHKLLHLFSTLAIAPDCWP